MTPKTLLVSLGAIDLCIAILVPKRRGEGFIKTPVYHNIGPITAIEHEIDFDIYGLDGALEIQTGSLYGKDTDAMLAKIMPLLCAHYGMDYRLVDRSEFWEKHPIARG